MSSYKVIFFPKALKGIATYTYPADGQTEARGTCPNAQHGWVETATGSHPVDVRLSLAQPSLNQAQGHFPAQRCSPAMLGLRNASGAETGVSHSCREGWAV